MPAHPAIQVSELVVDFRRRQALKGATLTAHAGRVYGLIGPNGAGKSTLMGSVLGLVRPSSGTIRIEGSDWAPTHLSRIGASINGPAFYPHLTAEKNLRVHALLLGADPATIAYVLDRVGLGSAAKEKTKRFSTGMRCRLALAMALLGDPGILLLDEPQNGLDPEGVRELRHILRSFADGGGSVIVSSHQLGEVAHMADDIGVLADGRTRWEGPLSEFAPLGEVEDAYFRLVTPRERVK